MTTAGFPHSEICGSMDICSSPQLIAACHVLLRLLVPRHPPCALCSLTSSLCGQISLLASAFAISRRQRLLALTPAFKWPASINSLYLPSLAVIIRFSRCNSPLHAITAGGLPYYHGCPAPSTASLWPFSQRAGNGGLNGGQRLVPTSRPSRLPRRRTTGAFHAGLRSRFGPYCLLQLVGSSGLEPPTSRLSGARSNRLSYEPESNYIWSRNILRYFPPSPGFIGKYLTILLNTMYVIRWWR